MVADFSENGKKADKSTAQFNYIFDAVHHGQADTLEVVSNTFDCRRDGWSLKGNIRPLEPLSLLKSCSGLKFAPLFAMGDSRNTIPFHAALLSLWEDCKPTNS
jgi:hypothetical protein